MSIRNSVGLYGVNNGQDVAKIQTLLTKKGFKLRVDGICGNNTISAIRRFQKSFLKVPDAKVDVDGKTIRLLNSAGLENKSIGLTTHVINDGVGAKYNVQVMAFSSKGVQLLKDYEQLRLKPYDDQTGKDITDYVKGATIGYGYLIKNASEFEKFKNGITASTAESLFRSKFTIYENGVKNFIKVNLTQNEFDALAILCYNIGVGNSSRGFGGSTVVKVINGESNADLDESWKMWNKTQGKISRGLINRRNSELQVYHKGVYIKL